MQDFTYWGNEYCVGMNVHSSDGEDGLQVLDGAPCAAKESLLFDGGPSGGCGYGVRMLPFKTANNLIKDKGIVVCGMVEQSVVQVVHLPA